MIPLLHDFTGAAVLVFGGGDVGARRARHFAREARVIVLSPDFPAQSYGDAELIRAKPEPALVADWIRRISPALVVAATDDAAVNTAVADAAHRSGMLVNRADGEGLRDPNAVAVPATARTGPVSIAVGTDGTSPALAGHLRRRVETDLDGADAMARLTGTLRSRLQGANVEPERRRRTVRAVVDSREVWKALRSGTEYPPDEAMDVIASALGWSRDEVDALLDQDREDPRGTQ